MYPHNINWTKTGFFFYLKASYISADSTVMMSLKCKSDCNTNFYSKIIELNKLWPMNNGANYIQF